MLKVGDKVKITTSNKYYKYYGKLEEVINITSGYNFIVNIKTSGTKGHTTEFHHLSLTLLTEKQYLINRILPKYE